MFSSSVEVSIFLLQELAEVLLLTETQIQLLLYETV